MYYNNEWTFIDKKDFTSALKKSFELKNLKKLQAKKMKLWNWSKLPDLVKFYEVWREQVKVPPGIRWIWNTRFQNKYKINPILKHPDLLNPFWDEEDLELSNKQNIAVSSLLKKPVWLLHASTWVWKTAITAKIINKLQKRTLVVCCSLELLQQMKDDLFSFFWVNCRTISGTKTKQKWCYENIVIWNIDSLVKLPKEYFDQFDLVIMDEVDKYLSAENRIDFISNLHMEYYYWLTWTIKVNHTEDKIFQIFFWDKTELLEKHFQPNIFRVRTDFEYTFDTTEKFNKEYSNMKKELYSDNRRNNLIIDTIINTLDNRKWIVFCEYIEHSKEIVNRLNEKWIKTFMLIWEVTKEERIRIKKELKEYKWPCILVGSVKIIWRGFSVAELSIWYLTTCEKFTSNIWQYVGRIIRKFKWKTDCLWYDFIDINVKILSNQAKSRFSTYKREFPNSNNKII